VAEGESSCPFVCVAAAGAVVVVACLGAAMERRFERYLSPSSRRRYDLALVVIRCLAVIVIVTTISPLLEYWKPWTSTR
jgi:hypothetical protein